MQKAARTGITALAAIAVSAAAGTATGGPVVAADVLFTTPADIASGPLEVPPSSGRLVAFGGQPRIANDGTWYGGYVLGVLNPNDPLEFTRDRAFLRDGDLFIREGLQLSQSPGFVLLADLTASQTPLFDVSIAQDGTVAQVVRVIDTFSTLADGTPDPSGFEVGGPQRLDAALVDGKVVLKTGDLVPGVSDVLAVDDIDPNTPGDQPSGDLPIAEISTIKAASATKFLVDARMGGTESFAFQQRAIFEINNPGTAQQTATLRFTTDENFPVPGLGGITASSISATEEDVDFNTDGSILLSIDIRNAAFDEDGAVVLYDAVADTYSIVAREGDPSPIPGRPFDAGLFNTPVALNDAGDIAYVGRVAGSSSDDTLIIVNGSVVAQEGDLVGTRITGALQTFPLANLELDGEGNVLYYGAWNQDNLCTGQTDNGSDFGIFEGIFFNDELIIEAGVTEVNNVDIDGTVFPTLVVKDLVNSSAGFSLSPDGDRLINWAFCIEPSMEVCDFSINVTSPGEGVLFEIDLEEFRNPSTNACRFDFDGNGSVDGADFGAFGAAFGSVTGGASYDAQADSNADGVVDGADFGDFGAEFGRNDCLD